MEDEFDAVLKTIKTRKVAGLDEIPPEIWKTKKFDDILLWLCNTVYKQNKNREIDQRLHSLLSEERLRTTEA